MKWVLIWILWGNSTPLVPYVAASEASCKAAGALLAARQPKGRGPAIGSAFDHEWGDVGGRQYRRCSSSRFLRATQGSHLGLEANLRMGTTRSEPTRDCC